MRAQSPSYAAHGGDAAQQMDLWRSRHGPATIPGSAPQAEPDGRPCEEATFAAFPGAISAGRIRTTAHQWSIRRQMTERHAGYGRKSYVSLDGENADCAESGRQGPRRSWMSESWQHLLRDV